METDRRGPYGMHLAHPSPDRSNFEFLFSYMEERDVHQVARITLFISASLRVICGGTQTYRSN